MNNAIDVVVFRKSYPIVNSKSLFRHYYLHVKKFKNGQIIEEYEFHPGMRRKKTPLNFYNGNKAGRVEKIVRVCENCLLLMENECRGRFNMLRRNCDVMAGFAFQTVSITVIVVFSLLGVFVSRANFVVVIAFIICFAIGNFIDFVPKECRCEHVSGEVDCDVESIIEIHRRKRLLGL